VVTVAGFVAVYENNRHASVVRSPLMLTESLTENGIPHNGGRKLRSCRFCMTFSA
jgi:hypothetical protein